MCWDAVDHTIAVKGDQSDDPTRPRHEQLVTTSKEAGHGEGEAHP
jgi:hypothetical protein